MDLGMKNAKFKNMIPRLNEDNAAVTRPVLSP